MTTAQAKHTRDQIIDFFRQAGFPPPVDAVARRNPKKWKPAHALMFSWGEDTPGLQRLIERVEELPTIRIVDTHESVADWRPVPAPISSTLLLDIVPPTPPVPPAPVNPQPRFIRYGQRDYPVIDSCIRDNTRWHAIHILEYPDDQEIGPETGNVHAWTGCTAKLWFKGEQIAPPQYDEPLIVPPCPALETDELPVVIKEPMRFTRHAASSAIMSGGGL